MEWLKVAVEEYKTLRQESLTSINRQQPIFTFGAATIGLLVSAGTFTWDKTPLPEIIFIIFIPMIVYLLFFIWFGEFMRMVRVGRFLVELEKKINNKLRDIDALTWENWLSTGPRVSVHYISITLFFIITSIGSIAIGNCKILYTNGHHWQNYIWYIDLVQAQIMLLLGIYSIYLYRKIS